MNSWTSGYSEVNCEKQHANNSLSNNVLMEKKWGNILAFLNFVRKKSQYISKLRMQQKNLVLREVEQYPV